MVKMGSCYHNIIWHDAVAAATTTIDTIRNNNYENII